MANHLTAKGRSRFAKGELAWEDDTWAVAALDSTYTPSDPDDEYAAAFSGAVLAAVNLTGTTVLDGGICDADDVALTGVDAGSTIVRLAIYKVTGDLATSPVVYVADTNEDGTPIGRLSDGSSIPLNWSASTTRVFRV